MDDRACISFLQWALPQMGLRWPGFRKVRGQVRKRLAARLRELGLADLDAYRRLLRDEPAEWDRLAELCRITISRFYRDRAVFDALAAAVVPELLELADNFGQSTFRCLSLGCASGEEPYTLALLLRFHPLCPRFWEIEGIDADQAMLERARRGCYPGSSLKELPQQWLAEGFERQGGLYCLLPQLKQAVGFSAVDILRDPLPARPCHLVLCRNLVFTYFDSANQQKLLSRLHQALLPGGGLVIGVHESLPPARSGFEPWLENLGIFRKIPE